MRNMGIKGLENAVNTMQIREKHRAKFRLWSSSPCAPARKHSVIVKVTECFLVLWAVLEGEKFGVVQSTHSSTLIVRLSGSEKTLTPSIYSLFLKRSSENFVQK